MNEYEHFKKWVNSFGVKIYYKLKPPTKKELYEIATRQEEEIERLKEEIKGYEQERERVLNIIEERNHKAIEYIEYYLAKGRTKNHKQFDLSLYEILTGKNLFNLTMKEIEQFFKGVDEE